MLEITQAQLDMWLALFMYPLARILGLINTAPVFSNRTIPVRIRLIVGLVVLFALIPMLEQRILPPLSSYNGLLCMIQEGLIGMTMGLSLRLVFAAISLAGDLIGLQMGLSFAVFFDPNTAGQTAVLAEIITLIATMIFFASDAHLMLLEGLARSFIWVPINGTPFGSIGSMQGWVVLAKAATLIFSIGLMLALPLICTLLMVNIALAVLTRAAPQLNLFAVGFPITSTVGFGFLIITLRYFPATLQNMFDQSFDILEQVLHGFK